MIQMELKSSAFLWKLQLEMIWRNYVENYTVNYAEELLALFSFIAYHY